MIDNLFFSWLTGFQVDNALQMSVIEWSLLLVCDLYELFCGPYGPYGWGREDNSPDQPHMWEIPKDTPIPPSLRLRTYRRKSEPDYNTAIDLGPAFPMSLDCLNENLEKFMQEHGQVIPVRQWFTPDREFCKMYPQCVDWIRWYEIWCKEHGIGLGDTGDD